MSRVFGHKVFVRNRAVYKNVCKWDACQEENLFWWIKLLYMAIIIFPIHIFFLACSYNGC